MDAMSVLTHPITEFAFLNLNSPTKLETRELVSGFQTGSASQSSWSGYPVHLFHSTQQGKAGSNTPVTTIYLISGWASVQAHNEWIASPKNQEIMKSFRDAGLMDVGGLTHLDIDFTKLSFEECAVIVWRKMGHMDDGDDSKSDGGGRVKSDHETVRHTADFEPEGKARMLWSYRGQAVDEETCVEYELTAYTEGKLGEFGDGFTVVQKWRIEA